MSIGIYKITSPSGRIYIGQSCRLETRKEYYRRNDCKAQTRLYASFMKYGWKNHVLEVIEYCDIDQLNNRERHWQEFYDVLSKKGLNCRYVKSDDKSGIQSAETIAKKSLANKGKKRHPSVGRLHSYKLNNGIVKCMHGRKHSEKTKALMSKNTARAMLGKTHSEQYKQRLSNELSKPVLDTYTGVYYFNCSEVAELYNIKKTTLSCKLNGNRKNNTRFIYA